MSRVPFTWPRFLSETERIRRSDIRTYRVERLNPNNRVASGILIHSGLFGAALFLSGPFISEIMRALSQIAHSVQGEAKA